MTIKTRIMKLEGHDALPFVPSGNPVLDKLNLALHNMARKGITWVEVLKSIPSHHANSTKEQER